MWQGTWQPLGVESSLQLTASKEIGTSVLQPQELNSAINKNFKLEVDFFLRTSRQGFNLANTLTFAPRATKAFFTLQKVSLWTPKSQSFKML